MCFVTRYALAPQLSQDANYGGHALPIISTCICVQSYARYRKMNCFIHSLGEMLLRYTFLVKNIKEHSVSLTSILSESLVVSITTVYMYNVLSA